VSDDDRGQRESRPGWASSPPPPPPGAPPAGTVNTGGPAAVPSGISWWEPERETRPHGDQPPEPYSGPEIQVADPTVADRPPWPRLVATGAYQPPPLITWPILLGLAAVAVYTVAFLALGASSGPSQQTRWLERNGGVIARLTADQRAIAADYRDSSGTAALVRDWTKLHHDAVEATSIANPGGSATVPWREMLNDFVNSSSDVVQGIVHRDNSLISQAEAELQAAEQASAQFYRAMGVTTP
jgi:hypothetical protein